MCCTDALAKTLISTFSAQLVSGTSRKAHSGPLCTPLSLLEIANPGFGELEQAI